MTATSTTLVNYDAARSALQKAHRVDEAKAIRDKAEAIRVYARQANDVQMQNWAVEIKLRAERRAGELIREQQAAKVLDAGKGGDRKSDHRRGVATLKSIGVSRDQSSKWQRLAAVPEAKFERIVAETKEKAKELTSAAVLQEIRQLDRRSETEQKLRDAKALSLPSIEVCDLRVCSMQALLAEVRDVDLILCDPPYAEENIPLYADLARAAKKALKPGGVLAVMVPNAHLLQIGASMSEHMRCRWTDAYMLPGPAARIWSQKIYVGWKPVLLFGDVQERWMSDVIWSDKPDKRFCGYGWGQSESGFERLVECLSEPGGLVCDPFVGGGTTAVAALKLGRRFVGCDHDKKQIETARARVALAQDGLRSRVQFGPEGCGNFVGPYACCTCVCGDAEKLLLDLPMRSVSAVITDAPYGLDAESWDGKVPYHLLPTFLQLTDGPILWFGSAPGLVEACRSFDPEPERVLIWEPAFTTSHLMTSGLQYRFHAIYAWHLPKEHDGPTWDVLHTPTERGNWWHHPCTKPLALMSDLCGIAPAGGIVLDPFAGSGSTLVAAKAVGRHFLGFEKDERYCAIAATRLHARTALDQGCGSMMPNVSQCLKDPSGCLWPSHLLTKP